MTQSERSTLLHELIKKPMENDTLVERLSAFQWDCEYPLVRLERADLACILNEFRNGRLPSIVVERWADAIEVRDDIEFADDKDEVVADIVHILANPLLEGQLTDTLAEALLIRLQDEQPID